MYGYQGQILCVDLTSGNITRRAVTETFARSYIGGIGFAAAFYLEMIRNRLPHDAYSPDNPFVIMTGPLTGMKLNGTARWVCCTRSPLTGFFAESNIGGFFGAELKFAGYDGIVITGCAASPVYLLIDDDTVELRDAGPYWGMDTYDTTDAMTADLANGSRRKGRVFTIGPGGENLVRFASIVSDKGHLAGRAGMGAVWGAKKLKAIYVRGTGKVPIADAGRFSALKTTLKEAYEDSIYIDALRTFGTASYMDVGVIAGDIPMKNWQQGEWDDIDALGPLAYEEKMLTGRATCYGCGVACKREAEVRSGPFAFPKGPGPEYEALATFGTLCLNADITAVGKANDICNRYGIDTISCGATVAFAIECFEKGLITSQDTEGLELHWGNAASIVALTEKIARRDGFGTVLAEGSRRAADIIGEPAHEFLTTVKGLEAPMHDPRSYHSFGLAYAVTPRGACHTASPIFAIESGGLYLPEIPEFATEPVGMESTGKAQFTIACQDFGTFFTGCAVFCNLGASPVTAQQAIEAVNCVTGFDYTLEEVMRQGRRIWYLTRGLANLFGARAQDDVLPKRIVSPLAEGPTAGSVPDMTLMTREFYKLRRLTDDGVPSRDVLMEENLTDLAYILYGGE